MEIKQTLASQVRWLLLRRGDKVASVLWGAVFLVCLISSITLPFGDISMPGPGVWPSMVSAFGLVASAALFLSGKDIPVLAKDQTGRRLVLYLAAIVGYAPLYVLIGFLPASALILVALIRYAGGFSWPATVISALVGPPIVYAIFGIGLEVPLDAF